MNIDTRIFETETSASVLRALRANSGVKGETDALFGRSFSSGTIDKSVAGGSSTNVLVKNPQGSGQVIFVRGTIRASGTATAQKYDNVSIDTAGTTEPINNRLVADGESIAVVESDVTFSGGNAWNPKPIGGGHNGATLTPGVLTGPDLILTDGDTVVYEVTNETASDERIGIDTDFVEVDRDELSDYPSDQL
jgi:hypothetical protein